MQKKFFSLMLILALLFTGCTQSPADSTSQTNADNTGTTNSNSGSAAQSPSDLFSDRDLRGDYTTAGSTVITLNGTDIQIDGKGATSENGILTISAEGTYLLSGTLDEGMILVDAEKTEKVQLVLAGVSITSSVSAPIYIRQADKVFLTLAEDTENALHSGESFTAIDENNIDATIFSKEDLTINGNGNLTVTAPAGHGIVSKDELTITGGSLSITCANHGLSGKDSVCISGGSFSITSGKDGIQADNDEDTTLGFIFISGGSFDLNTQGDGISASSTLTIESGNFTIETGGGSVNGENRTSGGWGMMGGGPGGMGGPGGWGGFGGFEDASEETEDSTSIKGLKSAGNMTLSGGNFTIDSADDAIHTNASVTISGGEYTISTGDDGVHADETLTITGCTMTVTESYEALEALDIAISGGDFTLNATDDGLNAAGGVDSSGFGGDRGGDQFGGRGGPGGMGGGMGGPGGMGGNSDGSIEISGGNLYVCASGDGIDANGYLLISGGYVVVCGPTMGDTATLDYDTTATITGGTFIGTGASGMAQTFSDSQQGVIAVNVGGQYAGTEFRLTDENGEVVLQYAPNLDYAVVILSSPDMVKGESYTITLGEVSGTFTAS
ncbi:MAG: carbohydrate-binding domain-containing protein [Ruminococcaceae bacterium]|nr:carbohydrate-binding domain-containing protein [Oscillospiraceae bacterium]